MYLNDVLNIIGYSTYQDKSVKQTVDPLPLRHFTKCRLSYETAAFTMESAADPASYIVELAVWANVLKLLQFSTATDPG